jgi:hypothetical protein
VETLGRRPVEAEHGLGTKCPTAEALTRHNSTLSEFFKAHDFVRECPRGLSGSLLVSPLS